MDEQNVDWQLVPPGINPHNTAGKGNHNIKNHFKAGIASADDDFPIHLW